ncbi:MAG: hypothetical protein LBT55_00610 [Clostridiaceae bacterium]|jgi:hypothetical protein|nr:hypothetical protein [Clostridiaceae bacterium]
MKTTKGNKKFKNLAALFVAIAITATLVFAFTACGTNEKTEPVSVTVIIGEKTLEVETNADKVIDLLTDLKNEGKISAFVYSGSKYGAYVTELDALKEDALGGVYIAVYHNIDDIGLHDFDAVDYSVITKEINGNTYFFSGVGISLLPVEEGAVYVFQAETYSF